MDGAKIKLAFVLEDEQDLLRHEPSHVRESPHELFLGRQTFTVDEIDFSFDRVSILWFTWHLRLIRQWIAVGTKPYDIDVKDNVSALQFSKVADQVSITRRDKHGSEETFASVSVQANLLACAIKDYYRTAYKACCAVYPALETHEALKSWWCCRWH